MKPHPSLSWAALLASGVMLVAGSATAAPFSYLSDSEAITAIASRTYNGYNHVRHPDGTFTRENFVFGNGGQLTNTATEQDVAGYQGGIVAASVRGAGTRAPSNGSVTWGTVTADPSIDQLSFNAIARDIRGPLAEENFRASNDPKQTQLLIMVFWGRASGTNHVTDGPARDAIVAFNGQLMGFDQESWLQAHNDWSSMYYGRSFRMQLLDQAHAWNLSALESDRYYVILRAFDFQAAWRQKKIKLLWETRFSLSERGHYFNEELPVMAQAASHYFGQASGGLIRTPLKDTQVEIGELKNLGEADPDATK